MNRSSLPMGEQLKQEGLALVRENHARWMEVARWKVVLACIGNAITEFGADDVRQWVEEEPAHPNAWGGLLNAMARAGLIQATGRFRKSRLAAAHSRRVAVWQWMGGGR